MKIRKVWAFRVSIRCLTVAAAFCVPSFASFFTGHQICRVSIIPAFHFDPHDEPTHAHCQPGDSDRTKERVRGILGCFGSFLDVQPRCAWSGTLLFLQEQLEDYQYRSTRLRRGSFFYLNSELTNIHST